jgi:hypothetical protein
MKTSSATELAAKVKVAYLEMTRHTAQTENKIKNAKVDLVTG